MQKGYLSASDALLTLRAISAIDQGGYTWVIDENGDFLRSRYGDAYQKADPELFLSNDILNDTLISRKPNEAIGWDLPPKQSLSPSPALQSKIKMKSSLPELNFLNKLKWKTLRTPFLVSTFIFLAFIIFVSFQDRTSKESSLTKNESKVQKTRINLSELAVEPKAEDTSFLIFKGALASDYTTEGEEKCPKKECNYSVELRKKEDILKFKVTVVENKITKVEYYEKTK